MPTYEHLVLCGGLEHAAGAETSAVRLSLYGASPNVRLQLKDISRPHLANLPDALVDLLEIAAYVYAADGVVSRGGSTDAQMGQRWRRRFRFVVPVREPELWEQQERKFCRL